MIRQGDSADQAGAKRGSPPSKWMRTAWPTAKPSGSAPTMLVMIRGPLGQLDVRHHVGPSVPPRTLALAGHGVRIDGAVAARVEPGDAAVTALGAEPPRVPDHEVALVTFGQHQPTLGRGIPERLGLQARRRLRRRQSRLANHSLRPLTPTAHLSLLVARATLTLFLVAGGCAPPDPIAVRLAGARSARATLRSFLVAGGCAPRTPSLSGSLALARPEPRSRVFLVAGGCAPDPIAVRLAGARSARATLTRLSLSPGARAPGPHRCPARWRSLGQSRAHASSLPRMTVAEPMRVLSEPPVPWARARLTVLHLDGRVRLTPHLADRFEHLGHAAPVAGVVVAQPAAVGVERQLPAGLQRPVGHEPATFALGAEPQVLERDQHGDGEAVVDRRRSRCPLG